MTGSVGPTRLVLINSGKYDYGEVDLRIPLHLVGPNNVGKTTLISTLQYLYIDDQRQMHFSRDSEETRRYYFPSPDSYILFECLTPAGYMVVGAAGLGPIEGYKFRRFCYRGTYERSDFLDPDGRMREAAEIRKDLGLRDYVVLSPSELQSALTGIGRHPGASLGLVPVRNRDGYERFRTIFRNLLRLSHLTQQEMKAFLLDIYSSELRRTGIDLSGDYSREYGRVADSARELADLRANAAAAGEVLRLDEERRTLRNELPVIRSAILASGRERILELERDLGKVRQEREDLGIEDGRLEQDRTARQRDLGEMQRGIGAGEVRLQRLVEETARFESYIGGLEKGRLEEKEDGLTAIRLQLADAGRESEGQVRRRMETASGKLESLRRKLANISGSAASSWGELPAGSDMLFRLLNEEILSLPSGPEGVEVFDRKETERALQSISERIRDGRFRNSAVSLNLSQLAEPSLDQLGDRPALELTIAGLQSSIDRDRSALGAAGRREELEREASRLLTELEVDRVTYSDWLRFSEDRLSEPVWREELERLRARSKETESELASIERRRDELKALEAGASARLSELETGITALRERLESLPPVPGDQSADSPASDSGVDLESLFRVFSTKYRKEAELSERISGMLRSMETGTYGRYRAAEELLALQSMREDLEALDRKEEAVRKLWLGLATALGEAFKALLDSLETLQMKIADLNRRLASTSISDLTRLSLRIGEDHAKTAPIRRQVQDEEMPLFSDRKAVEQALRDLSDLLRTSPSGRIELEDLFNISFEVQTADGRTKIFTKLENIESHGTTIAIKVLVNLMLLRGLLSNRDVRIPFYLDEASSLDRSNLQSVVETAFGLGFTAILASPDAMDVAGNIYFLKEPKNSAGRVHLDPELSRIHVDRQFSGKAEALDEDSG